MKKIHFNIILIATALLLAADVSDYAACDDFAEHTEFITTKRIHPDMPEFTFIRTLGDFVDIDHFELQDQRHVSLMILDENGNLIQKIDDIIQGGYGRLDAADTAGFEPQFDDFDFDGYLDMRLYRAFNPGSMGGAWAYFWLWDADIGQFVLDERLSRISDWARLHVNQETRQIEVSSRAQGTGPWATQYYEYIDGEFVAVADMFMEWRRRDFVPSFMVRRYEDFVTGVVEYVFDPPYARPDHIIIKTVDINPDMEFPIHEVRLEMWLIPEDSEHRVGGYEYEIAITIEGIRGEWLSWHNIRGLRSVYPPNLHFTDFNGDGYLDISVRRAYDNYYIWLFDPEATSLWSAFRRDY